MTTLAPSRLYVAQNEPNLSPHHPELRRNDAKSVEGVRSSNDNEIGDIKKCLPVFAKLKERALWCPNTKTDVMCFDTYTGKQFFRTCQKDSCVCCAPARCWWKGWAIQLSGPTHIITITNMGDDWFTINRRMKAFHRRVRQIDPSYECAWTVESNPKGTGNHVHAWARLQHHHLSLDGIGEKIGGGFAEAEALRSKEGPAIYFLKTVIALHGKPLATAGPAFERYMQNNGGRLLHSTQGFWPEYEGKRHIKNAERLAKRNRRGVGTKERYLFIPASQIPTFRDVFMAS